MKLQLTLAVSLVAALAFVGCSSSSSSNSTGSSSGVFCSVTSNGAQSCAGSRNIPASSQKSYKDQCTQGGGKIVSACPTDNLMGCCTQPGANGYSIESCLYSPSSDAGSTGDAGSMADTEKKSCESNGGTWSTTS